MFKRISVLLGVALGFGALAVGVAQGSTKSITFTGTETLTNPCNGHTVTLSGPVRITVNETVARNGSQHATVHFAATGRGDDYTFRVAKTATFDEFASSFQFPLRVLFIGHRGATNFVAQGVETVFMSGDQPVGSSAVVHSARCAVRGT